ncbi:PQQ-dependent sugar dehydrogenase [Orrella sp. JC864]|uniref:PQQ-dependent sugar dehydrogenase n=1 Tax=Orrella sp. JC864 TaxID=3120298 RepID=UPI00300B154B
MPVHAGSVFGLAARAAAWLAALLALLSMALPARAQAPAYRIETVAEGLAHPWSLAFLPDGGMLVTERPGRLRLIGKDGRLSPPLPGTPYDFVAAQAGLMDVAVDPEFDFNQTIYLTYAYGTRRANNTRLARARLVDGRLVDVQTLFDAQPAKPGGSHYGGRMALLPDGTLVLTLGDGFDQREQAQDPASHLGKTVRLNRDGSVPPDNPFVGRPDAAPEIYTMGHRNVQGIVHDPRSGRLYAHEHGPRGGDELNLLRPGRNYGWPLATHGVDYTGARISPHRTLPGLEDPLLHWTPSVAPSGMALYTGGRFAQWQGDLFVSTLVEPGVRRVAMRDGRPTGEQEVLFGEAGTRIRDVRAGPDGALYLLTDEAQGRVLRVVPYDA